MTTKRVNLLAGAILGGLLIVGTAGLALAVDPTSSPAGSPTQGMPGGMMGGQGLMGGPGMMGGQGLMGGPGMMGGQGLMGGPGMMGGMPAGQMPDMTAMHAAMGEAGTCDPAVMQTMHDQYHPTR